MSWPLIELGNACLRVSVGHVGKTSEFYTDDSGVPFLRTQNVDSSGVNTKHLKFITRSFHETLKKSQLKTNDVIISRVISTNINCGLVPKELDNSNCANVILVRPDKAKLDSKFLLYFLRSAIVQRNLLKRKVGSAQSVVNTSILKSWEIPLPPLAEQKRIAAILDKADAIRRKRQQAIKLADDFLRSVFLDMFGDPVSNPKRWEVKTIQNLCHVSSGSTPSRKNDSYFIGSIPWVKTGEVDGYEITYTEEHISEQALQETSCRLNPKGSIVLAMYGQGKTRGRVGLLGVEAATNQACAVIKPSENIDMLYLYNYLRLSYERLRSLGQGGGQPNLNSGIVKNFEIIVPDRHLQTKFVEIVNHVDHVIKTNGDFQSYGAKFFNSLSQKAFAGEL